MRILIYSVDAIEDSFSEIVRNMIKQYSEVQLLGIDVQILSERWAPCSCIFETVSFRNTWLSRETYASV
jgi:hypothetical protein